MEVGHEKVVAQNDAVLAAEAVITKLLHA
jgi:hypothetical protein